MTATTKANLLAALAELQNTVKSIQGVTPKPSLLPLFSRIDELAGQLPSAADPELRHFLERRSYGKARLLLESSGQENAQGSCGH